MNVKVLEEAIIRRIDNKVRDTELGILNTIQNIKIFNNTTIMVDLKDE